MVHGTPNYFNLAPELDIISFPPEVQAYMDELTAQPDPVDTAPPMHGTLDSIYDAGNPAVLPG
jgi:hypothetical protein